MMPSIVSALWQATGALLARALAPFRDKWSCTVNSVKRLSFPFGGFSGGPGRSRLPAGIFPRATWPLRMGPALGPFPLVCFLFDFPVGLLAGLTVVGVFPLFPPLTVSRSGVLRSAGLPPPFGVCTLVFSF